MKKVNYSLLSSKKFYNNGYGIEGLKNLILVNFYSTTLSFTY